MSILLIAAIVLAACFGLSVAATAIIIPVLRRWHVGQKILEIGPKWHKSKEGTPTMGGILFPFVVLFGVALGLVLRGEGPTSLLISTLLYAVCNGAIGLLDDLQKFKKKQNLGLLPWQKLLLQTLFSALYLFWLFSTGEITTAVSLPFSDVTLELGPFYWFVMMFCMVGIVNCANLTDGIDGLAAAVALVIALFFGIEGVASQTFVLAIVGVAVVGTVGGFLPFNFHPASVFMGDTGSLFLGALTVGFAFLADAPLLMLICGLVYVLEGFSVVLQVIWYKLTKKRLFLMAPLHHHLEKRGWREPEIVILFTFVTLAATLLSHFAML